MIRPQERRRHLHTGAVNQALVLFAEPVIVDAEPFELLHRPHRRMEKWLGTLAAVHRRREQDRHQPPNRFISFHFIVIPAVQTPVAGVVTVTAMLSFTSRISGS